MCSLLRCALRVPYTSNPTNSLHGKGVTPEKDDADIVYYSENQEYLELSSTFADIIELAKPMNPVCTKQCKGLCPVCGINNNNVSCSCKINENETAWDALKQIKPEKS